MPRKIKECYIFLDLPFTSTLEQIETKQKILNKAWHARELEKNRKFPRQIKKVNEASQTLIDYVSIHGVQEDTNYFTTSPSNFGVNLFWLILSIIFCVATFIALV